MTPNEFIFNELCLIICMGFCGQNSEQDRPERQESGLKRSNDSNDAAWNWTWISTSLACWATDLHRTKSFFIELYRFSYKYKVQEYGSCEGLAINKEERIVAVKQQLAVL